MLKIFKSVLLIMLMVLFCQPLMAQEIRPQKVESEARDVYSLAKNSVYQIQVIDLASGKKSSTGSGFCFTSSGYVATNYHVVADAVEKGDSYRVEYVDSSGNVYPMELVNVDVVHDLAILLKKDFDSVFLHLGSSEVNQGETVFSMGNPHDLGMTIIEGTYNGLMEETLYQKILFSGSLNPGMSGGPALNNDGQVIGINVSTRGEQVSFLVPVEFLRKLYEEVNQNGYKRIENFESLIEQQLLDNQDKYVAKFLSAQWNEQHINAWTVPGEMDNSIKCWGESRDEQDLLFKKVRSVCSNREYIFLSSDLYTSFLRYQYLWHESKGLNAIRFYHHLESEFSNSGYSVLNGEKEDFTNFKCNTEFLDVSTRSWKTAFCARRYKRFPRLFDVILTMSTIDQLSKSMMVELKISGVEKKNALALVEKFMGEIQWKD